MVEEGLTISPPSSSNALIQGDFSDSPEKEQGIIGMKCGSTESVADDDNSVASNTALQTVQSPSVVTTSTAVSDNANDLEIDKSLVQKAMTGYFHGSDRRLGSPAQVKKRSRMGTSFHAKIGACKQKERYKHIEKRERRRQIGGEVDLPQVYMQDSPNAIKNFKKGRIKGGKFTIDPAESTLPSLDDRFQNINWSSSYFQPPVEEANNNMGIIFIEMDDATAGSSQGSVQNLSVVNKEKDDDGEMIIPDDISLSTVGSLARKLASKSGTATKKISHTIGKSDPVTMKQPDHFVLLNKYSKSQSSMGMDTQPYQIHGRMMGWKLTTRSRRRKLFRIIDQVKMKEGEGFVYDSERLKTKQKELERVSLRSTGAYEQQLRRMVEARCRNPKHMVEMARLSMSPNPSTLSNYLTDRFNIITTAEKQQGENSNYLPDIRRTLSSRGYEVDLESSVGDDEQSSIAQSISLISQMKEGKRTKVRRNTRLEDDFQWLDVETNQRLSLEALESHIDLFEPLGERLGILRPLTPATPAKKEVNTADESKNELHGDELAISDIANEDMNSVISALLDMGVEDAPGPDPVSIQDTNSSTVLSVDEFERKLEEIRKQNESNSLSNVVNEVVREVDMINEHHEQLEEHLSKLNEESRCLTDEEKNAMRASFDKSYVPPIEIPSNEHPGKIQVTKAI